MQYWNYAVHKSYKHLKSIIISARQVKLIIYCSRLISRTFCRCRQLERHRIKLVRKNKEVSRAIMEVRLFYCFENKNMFLQMNQYFLAQ